MLGNAYWLRGEGHGLGRKGKIRRKERAGGGVIKDTEAREGFRRKDGRI